VLKALSYKKIRKNLILSAGTSFKFKNKCSSVKGIVQRDLTGVETRLKQSILLSYSVDNIFVTLKGNHHEKSIKPVSAS
jgi:hypothetical protein